MRKDGLIQADQARIRKPSVTGNVTPFSREPARAVVATSNRNRKGYRRQVRSETVSLSHARCLSKLRRGQIKRLGQSSS